MGCTAVAADTPGAPLFARTRVTRATHDAPGPIAAVPLIALPMAVPKPYDETTARVVLDAIAEGERVHAACKRAGISWPTFWGWKLDDPVLATRYAHAKMASASFWAERATTYAEDVPADRDEIARARLREDNARWRARVANPAEYGERVDVTSLGRPLVSGVVMLPAEDDAPRAHATARLLDAGDGATCDAVAEARGDPTNAQA